MPSNLAILLATPSADEDDNPNDDAVEWCDSKLQEVREVLERGCVIRTAAGVMRLRTISSSRLSFAVNPVSARLHSTRNFALISEDSR
jgi:hypothetical protein